MARNPRACRARSSASKPVASAQAPWTNTIVGVSAAMLVTAFLLTIARCRDCIPVGVCSLVSEHRCRGRQGCALQRHVPSPCHSGAHLPSISRFEGVYFIGCAARCDDTKTRQELGVAPRELQVTLGDSVRWLVERGHISGRQAGQLATT